MKIENIELANYEYVDIKSVKKSGCVVRMNDIQVEDNETFFLSNGILTHNSAIASFVEIRNPENQAGMPLRGKVLNVYGKAPIDAMENAEVADIVTALNLEFNEQMGEWVLELNVKIFDVVYKSIFEVDDLGNSVIKKVVCAATDKFHIGKHWVTVSELAAHPEKYRGYIHSIAPSTKTIAELSIPDYFHFRRLWDFRGFRKIGVAYEVQIGRSKFICNDIDDICVDGVWNKVAFFLKKATASKQPLTITKATPGTRLTRFHKLLKPAFDSKLKYSKVYIATDADPDGSSITNLLVNLFHEYFPELFWDSENTFINRITFPMIAATKGKQTKYYENYLKFEAGKEKKEVDNTWNIKYFKGLGTMEKPDWEHVFGNLDEYSVNYYDDGNLDSLMQIFFDSDAGLRKEWLAT
jgi:hypothetical protein